MFEGKTYRCHSPWHEQRLLGLETLLHAAKDMANRTGIFHELVGLGELPHARLDMENYLPSPGDSAEGG